MATQPQVSVTSPIHPAIERAKLVLFRPFDLGKWFTIGFCAWLARLTQGGFSGSTWKLPRQHPSWQSPWHEGFAEANWQQARGWVTENFYWILPVAIVLVGLGLVLWVLFTWLGSRGDFMFLHCVAQNRAEVAALTCVEHVLTRANALYYLPDGRDVHCHGVRPVPLVARRSLMITIG